MLTKEERIELDQLLELKQIHGFKNLPIEKCKRIRQLRYKELGITSKPVEWDKI